MRNRPTPRSTPCYLFFFNHTATTEIYTSSHTLSLHDALPIFPAVLVQNPTGLPGVVGEAVDRSEEHTSELQSRELISYAVFCLKKKKCRKSPGRCSARQETRTTHWCRRHP